MSELRQRPPLLDAPLEDTLAGAPDKDNLASLRHHISKFLEKKYNNKQFRTRAGLYLATFTLIAVYLGYCLVQALSCGDPGHVSAYLEGGGFTPIYLTEREGGLVHEPRSRERDYYIRRYRLDKLKSDSLPLNRRLADHRPEVCKLKPYLRTDLRISVIIVLDSAPASIVLRTIMSVITRTRRRNMAEIIVCTHKGGLNIDEYVYTLGLYQVKVVASKMTRSLSSARNEAAELASGDVLVFIPDASEILPGWAEPLLEAMEESEGLLAGLSMDDINGATFNQVEHVPWHLISTPRWDFVTAVPLEIPEHEQRRRALTPYPETTPVRTPVLQFLPWAARRDFYLKVGGLDEGMLGSTSEVPGDLIELSIRWWACGGEVAYLPCSKVAYLTLADDSNRPPDGTIVDNRLYNSHRTATRWASQYNQFYFESVPKAQYQPQSASTILEDKISTLNCQSFHWFLTTIATDWNYGNRLLRRGSIKSATGEVCADTMGKDGRYSEGRPEFYGCHGGYSQAWVLLTKNNHIETETGKCLMSDPYWHDVLTLDYCKAGHEWKFTPLDTGSNVGYLVYKDLCLEYRPENKLLFYVPCKQTENQRFIFEPIKP